MLSSTCTIKYCLLLFLYSIVRRFPRDRPNGRSISGLMFNKEFGRLYSRETFCYESLVPQIETIEFIVEIVRRTGLVATIINRLRCVRSINFVSFWPAISAAGASWPTKQLNNRNRFRFVRENFVWNRIIHPLFSRIVEKVLEMVFWFILIFEIHRLLTVQQHIVKLFNFKSSQNV